MEVILTLTDHAVVFHQGHVIAEGHPREVVQPPRRHRAYLGRSLSAPGDASVSGPLPLLACATSRCATATWSAWRTCRSTSAEGAVVALIGSNGAGKTTTLNAIAGLVPVSGGSVVWEG